VTAGPDTPVAAAPAAPPGGISRWTDIGGPVHYLDFGGPADGPVIVCVHGLGGAAVNWMALAPLLTASCRLLAPDLAGHGLTRAGGRGTGVAANRALLHQFMASVAAAPAAVTGLILIDPALPVVAARPDPLAAAMFALYLTPGVGRAVMARRRRLTAEQFVASVLGLCCVDPSRVPADVVARHLKLADQRATFASAERDFATALRSIVATASYPGRRAYRRQIRSITRPVLLIHGTGDRLVPIAVARAAARANPAWSLAEIAGVGHVPQLEAPAETARVITEWLGTPGRAAAEAATPLQA